MAPTGNRPTNDNRSKKRKYRPSASSSFLRGHPGVLFTCEHGREIKCEREGLHMLQFYMDQSENDQTKAPSQGDNEKTTKEGDPKAASAQKTDDDNALSLEDELKQLRQQTPKQNGQHKHFKVYDTGCRGTVFVMCHKPDCRLISPAPMADRAGQDTKKQDTNTSDQPENVKDKPDHGPIKKRAKAQSPSTEPQNQSGLEPSQQEPQDANDSDTKDTAVTTGGWDPVPVVELILRQAMPDHDHKGHVPPPSSRFLTRMIPVQATCSASMKEIQQTAKALLQRFLNDHPEQQQQRQQQQQQQQRSPTTFGIHVKRRNCEHLNSKQIIEALATDVTAMAPHWKVNLKEPQVKIWVEICRTTVGLSVFSTTNMCSVKKNFNLAEIRASSIGTNLKNDPERT